MTILTLGNDTVVIDEMKSNLGECDGNYIIKRMKVKCKERYSSSILTWWTENETK